MGLMDWLQEQDAKVSPSLGGFGGLAGALTGAGDYFTSIAEGLATQRPGESTGMAIGRGMAAGNRRLTPLFEQARTKQEDDEFRKMARERSKDSSIGDRERQLWEVVSQPGASGERMRTLLPSLWNAQAYDRRVASRNGLTLPNERTDLEIQSFRDRFTTEGIDLKSYFTTLQDPKSELSRAMGTKYAEAYDPRLLPERDRFRSWVLYHRNIENLSPNKIVPYGSWGFNPELGTYGQIGVPSPKPNGDPATQANESEEEKGLIDRAIDAGKSLIGWGDDEEPKPTSLEDELDALGGGSTPGQPIPQDAGAMSVEPIMSEEPSGLASYEPQQGLMSEEPVGSVSQGPMAAFTANAPRRESPADRTERFFSGIADAVGETFEKYTSPGMAPKSGSDLRRGRRGRAELLARDRARRAARAEEIRKMGLIQMEDPYQTGRDANEQIFGPLRLWEPLPPSNYNPHQRFGRR